MHLHLLGPSGSGTSTLGRLLALAYDIPFFDTDDFFWEPTDPPFTTPRPRPERISLLAGTLAREDDWVLAGSMLSWGDFLKPDIDLAIYLYVPPEERERRLRAREQQRFGARIDAGGDMHRNHQEFLAWALGYDTGGPDSRSRLSETTWLASLACPVLRLEDPMTPEAALEACRQAWCAARNRQRGLDPALDSQHRPPAGH